jgi:hypothetical protein
VDNEQTARVAENEFHRSRWWAYKWVKRYAESGLEGLKNLFVKGIHSYPCELLSGLYDPRQYLLFFVASSFINNS